MIVIFRVEPTSAATRELSVQQAPKRGLARIVLCPQNTQESHYLQSYGMHDTLCPFLLETSKAR
jgi:hypothetical protein